MTDICIEHRHLDVVCELATDETGDRAQEWDQLRNLWGLGSEPIPGGARLWLRAGGRKAAEDLAQRESGCCGFLDLAISAEGERVRVEITSPAAEAASVIASLVGHADGAVPCC